MKKLAFYLVILFLLFSCKSQQIAFDSICGTFEGTDSLYYVELKLNKDKTCYLKKTFELSKIECLGEWTMLNSNILEIKCHRNHVFSDMEQSLQGVN